MKYPGFLFLTTRNAFLQHPHFEMNLTKKHLVSFIWFHKLLKEAKWVVFRNHIIFESNWKAVVCCSLCSFLQKINSPPPLLLLSSDPQLGNGGDTGPPPPCRRGRWRPPPSWATRTWSGPAGGRSPSLSPSQAFWVHRCLKFSWTERPTERQEAAVRVSWDRGLCTM